MAGLGTTVALIKSMGKPDPTVIEQSVSDWLDDHPEATTTVQDGSITKAKLDTNLQETVDDVSTLKNAFGSLENEIFPDVNLLNVENYKSSSNTAVTNNGDGSYTFGTTDYGATVWETPNSVPAGQYVMTGTPHGFAVVSNQNSYSTGVIKRNESNNTAIFTNPANQKLYFIIRTNSAPSQSFTVSPKIVSSKLNVIPTIEEGINNLNNLFIERNSVKGILISYNGNINNQSACKEVISDFIPAEQGNELTVQLWATPVSSYKLGFIYCEYDSTKTYIRGATIEASDQNTYYKNTFAPQNANCAYVRICGRLFDDGHMMINNGSCGTSYMISWQDLSVAMNSIDIADNNKIALESFNLFIRKNASLGFIGTDGTMPSGDTAYREMTSDYIPVSPGDEITAQTWTDETHNLSERFVFFDSQKAVLSYDGATVSSVKHMALTYKAPANSAYVRIASRYLKTDGHMMVNLGNVKMAYVQSNEDIEGKFDAINHGGAYGLNNPLLRPAYPRIAMHRGFMNQAPENTIPAFTLAGQDGAWGIETDVWETTDGYFVISHDDDVSRMTDGTGKISEMTYAETQECTIDAGANIEDYPNLKMPLLEDYLKICRRYGCVPCIEIKGITNYGNFIDLIKEYGMEGSAVLASYWDETMFNTLRGLTAMPIMIVGTGNFSDIVGYAQRLPDLWIDMISTYITKENLELAHSANVPVAGWTYNLASQIESAVEIGMDIAISESVPKLTNGT